MIPDKEAILGMFDEIDPEKINDWEKKFLGSVREQYDNNGSLSEKQLDKLIKIHKDKSIE